MSRVLIPIKEAKKKYPLIPEAILYGLYRYFNERIPMGHFGTAVLENDLKLAFERGDIDSVKGLREMILFMTGNVPHCAWGSKEKLKLWLVGEEIDV